MNKEYALYEGDACIAVGTTKEIAEKLNIKERTVKNYGRKEYIKMVEQNKLDRRVLVECQ